MSSPARRFVIVSMMRTGSNLLQQKLNAIDGVICHGELLNQNEGVHPSLRHLTEGQSPVVRPSLRTENPGEYLDAILDRTPAEHTGFRIFPGHHNPTLKALVEDPSVHKIILCRNLLESYVSLRLAQQNNQWIINHAGTRKPWVPVQIEPNEFKNYALRISAYYYHVISRCYLTGQQTTPINYKQINDQETIDRLLQVFGGNRTYKAAAVTALRQNPEPLEQKIKNYAEIVKLLKQLDVADWLAD